MIDDLEDGDGRICNDGVRTGMWYALFDGYNKVHPAPTPAGTPYPPTLLDVPRETSQWAMRIVVAQGDGEYNSEESWGNGLGVDLAYDGTTYGHYDASQYLGIRFRLRASTELRVEVRVSSFATTLTDFGGECPEEFCDPHYLEVSVTPDWGYFELYFDDLGQEGWQGQCCDTNETAGPLQNNELTNVQFLVRKNDNSDVGFELWVDDLEFVPGLLD
jgi:hypothetical protein